MKMKYGKWIRLGFATLAALIVLLPTSIWRRGYNAFRGQRRSHSIESRLADFGDAANARLGFPKPPTRLRIYAFKAERRLDVFGYRPHLDAWTKMATYPILAASGIAGPKLREGDRQVPEGIYGFEFLHPNSNYYLALKIAYPGPEDIAAAIAEGRNTNTLGSHIMLHGAGGSIGCIAIPDPAMEEIFWLAANTGIENTHILIYPHDFRRTPLPGNTTPRWLQERYHALHAALLEQSAP